jgi:hypothetical protein
MALTLFEAVPRWKPAIADPTSFPKLSLTKGVAKAGGVGWLVILALIHKLRASLVVPEHFVVEIQARHNST